MFSADTLLIEKAQIALRSQTGNEPCTVSEPLDSPYLMLRLAVFRGVDGKRIATQARLERRFAFQGNSYRVIVDLSRDLGCEDALIVEAA